MVPLAQRQALCVGIMSYNGQINFGLIGDYDAMADLDALRPRPRGGDRRDLGGDPEGEGAQGRGKAKVKSATRRSAAATGLDGLREAGRPASASAAILRRSMRRAQRQLRIGSDEVVLQVRRSARARRARILVAPGKPPEVVVPERMSEREVDRVIREHRDWIAEKVAWAREEAARTPQLGLDRPGVVWLAGSPVPVELRGGGRAVAKLVGGRLRVDGAAEAAERRDRPLVPARGEAPAHRRHLARGRGARGRAGADLDPRPAHALGLVLGGRRDLLLVEAGHLPGAGARLRRRPRALSPALPRPLTRVLGPALRGPPRMARAGRLAAPPRAPDRRLRSPAVLIRRASPTDAGAIAGIYGAGVAEGGATFQTTAPKAASFERRIRSGELFLVAEEGGAVVGAGWVSDYDPVHDYYAGVGEVTLYVEPRRRRIGAGRALLEALAAAAEAGGRHKLVAKVFATNEASLQLFGACGYRRVGTTDRHGEVRGEWKDVVVVERLLARG